MFRFLGVSFPGCKMARSNWASSAMLMCLVAAETVLAYPKPGEPDGTSWLTQFPPEPTNGRVLIAQDLGVSRSMFVGRMVLRLCKVLSKGPGW